MKDEIHPSSSFLLLKPPRAFIRLSQRSQLCLSAPPCKCGGAIVYNSAITQHTRIPYVRSFRCFCSDYEWRLALRY